MIKLFENLFDSEVVNFLTDPRDGFVVGEPERGDQPGYALRIVEIPKGAYLVDIDSNFDVTSIFGSCHSQAKRPDYIIVDPSKSVVCVIELKGGKCKRRDIVSQLKGGEAFLKYCDAVIKIFSSNGNRGSCPCPCGWCQHSTEHSEYKVRYVHITGLSHDARKPSEKKYRAAGSPKRKISPPAINNLKSKVENTPDRFAKIGLEHMFLDDAGEKRIYWNKILYTESVEE